MNIINRIYSFNLELILTSPHKLYSLQKHPIISPSLHIHVELLFCSSCLQVLHLVFLVLKLCPSLGLFLLFALQIELEVELGHIIFDIAFCFLEIIFKHAPHTIEFECLIGVHLVLEFFLFLSLSFLLNLFIKPLLLFILEKLSTSVIF